jgi:hypothetical protein
VSEHTAIGPDAARVAAFDLAMAAARERLAAREPQQALALLERAHVLGQRDFGRHWRVHVLMLHAARAAHDGRADPKRRRRVPSIDAHQDRGRSADAISRQGCRPCIRDRRRP